MTEEFTVERRSDGDRQFLEVRGVLNADRVEQLAQEGFDPVFGARPLRRAVQRYVESVLSRKILSREFDPGDEVVVDADESGLTFKKAASAVAAGAP